MLNAKSMQKKAKIYLAGHTGLIGRALLTKLKEQGYPNVILRTREELDLRRQKSVEQFFYSAKPQYVIVAAARVGGIRANDTYTGEFIYDNITIAANVIHSAYLSGVKKLLFFSSSCSYPREALQPMKEDSILTGKLEPTNEPYAVAKIAGMTMCQAYNKQYKTNFITALLTNAYGPGDDFAGDDTHVIPALIKKFHQAKEKGEGKVTIWGTGKPLREFIFSDDAAQAAIFLMNNYNSSQIINVGSSEVISIAKLVMIIRNIVGFKGEVIFDTDKPDGMPRKFLDSSKINDLGWKAMVSLEEGIRKTYSWYLKKLDKVMLDEAKTY